MSTKKTEESKPKEKEKSPGQEGFERDRKERTEAQSKNTKKETK
jgi:hypothetical protein